MIWLLALLLFCQLALTHPHCAEPPTKQPPKYSDCEQIIRLIEDKAMHMGDPPKTASRRFGYDVQLPFSFNAALAGNTCAVNLDMVHGREWGVDRFRLSDVARVAQVLLDECLTPRIFAPAAEGWMNAGRYRIVNVTLEREHRVQLLRTVNGTHKAATS